MLTVACVLRSGGDFDASWVKALANGVRAHLRTPHRFVCLSDVEVDGVETVPLRHDWPRWWPKVELFRPGLFGGRVLYLDLDSLPVGSLDELAAIDAPFAMLSDFYRPEQVASGVMLWGVSKDTEAIYEWFAPEAESIMGAHRSRMDYWLAKVIPEPARIQQFVPGLVVSLKAHARKRTPVGAALVCGHGQPRLSHEAAGWAHEEWARRAA